MVAKIDIDALKLNNKWGWKLAKIKNSQPLLKIKWFL